MRIGDSRVSGTATVSRLTTEMGPPTVAQPTARRLDSHASAPAYVPPPDMRALAPAKNATTPVLRHPALQRYHSNLMVDIDTMVRFLSQDLPVPGLTCGSARLKPGTMDEFASISVGATLAAANIPPITGGGPSIMSWVPAAFRKALARMAASLSNIGAGLKTQGVNIILPHEQKLSEHIELHEEFREFPFRKYTLYHKTRGTIGLPGGFGTADEMFELHAQAARGQYKGRLGVIRMDFWKPFLDTIYTQAVARRPLISRPSWNTLEQTDMITPFIHHMPDAKTALKGQEPIAVTAARMRRDIDDTIRALDKLDASISILGGGGLSDNDPTIGVLREACRLMTKDKQPLMVGNPAAIARAAVEGALREDAHARVYGQMLRGEGYPQLGGLQVVAQQTDFIVHKDMLTRHSKGVVVLPGGLGTLSSLFAIMTEIQCKKRDRIPIVLVGKDFWQPIMDAVKAVMLSNERQTISPEDMELFVITDDPHQIAKAMRGEPLSPEKPSALAA